MKIPYLLFILSLLVTSSCETTVKKDEHIDQSVQRKEHIERFPFIKYKQQKLGLDSIQAGFDSIQIRLWNVQGLYGHIQLTILKNDGIKWSSSQFQINIDSNYSQGLDTKKYTSGNEPFYISTQKTLKPKFSWNRLIDSLVHCNIKTLPDMDSIPKMKVEWTDADLIVVEVATRSFYRFYHYSDPWRFEKDFNEARNFMRIVSIIHTTLN